MSDTTQSNSLSEKESNSPPAKGEYPEGGRGLTPKLRFPEFRGEWEVKRLDEILTLEYGNSLPESKRNQGMIPVIGSNGIFGYHKKCLISGPAIVIGRKGSVGKISWIDQDCYPIDTTYYVRNKQPELCLFSFLNILLERSRLYHLKDSSAVPGLNRASVYSLFSYLPKPKEQQKIADCLSSIDDLITAQSQKLNALEVHKKGLMQQLFPAMKENSSPPAKGEYPEEGRGLAPKLRFPEFRGEWEKKPLKEVATIIMGSSPRVFTTQTTRECFIGDILLGVRAPAGTVAKSKHHACIGRGIAAIRASTPNSREYLYQWLLSFESLWQNVSQGGTFDSINRDDIKLLIAGFPNPKEQKKIADCLSSIDDLITAQSQKFDALKAHKKGLMQQLFPAMDEVGV